MTQNKNNLNTSFFIAVLTLIGIFSASSSPIPLLGIFRDRLNILSADLAYTAVVYFLGCCFALVFLSRISNSIGRKKATLVALTLGFIATLIFMFVPNFTLLLTARFIHGLACGIASSSIMSYIIDTAPNNNKTLASFFNICGPAMGFCIGCGLSTLSVLVFNIEIYNIYIILSFFHTILILFVILKCQETINIDYRKLKKLLIPKFEVPKHAIPFVLATSASFITTWTVGGFFQSFITVVTEDALHLPSTFSGVFFIIFIGSQAIGGLISQKLEPVKCTFIFFTLYFSLTPILFLMAYFELSILFSLICFIMGFCATASGTSIISLTVDGSTVEQRAGIMASCYLAGYIGAGMPNLIIGRYFRDVEIDSVFIGYSIMTVSYGIIALFVLMWAIKSKRKSL